MAHLVAHTCSSHESEVVRSPYFFQCVNPTSPNNTRGELSYLGFVASEAPHWRRPQSFWRPAGPEKWRGWTPKNERSTNKDCWLTNINSGLKTNQNLWVWPGSKADYPRIATLGFVQCFTKIFFRVEQLVFHVQPSIPDRPLAMEFLRYSGGYEWENHLHQSAAMEKCSNDQQSFFVTNWKWEKDSSRKCRKPICWSIQRGLWDPTNWANKKISGSGMKPYLLVARTANWAI